MFDHLFLSYWNSTLVEANFIVFLNLLGSLFLGTL